MADAVTTTTVLDGKHMLVVHLTNVSDATGESAAVKVTKSSFVGPNGLAPTDFVLERAEFAISTDMRVLIQLDRTSAQTLCVLRGSGKLDWTLAGGVYKPSTGATGNVILTTAGQTTSSSYDITLYLRKKD